MAPAFPRAATPLGELLLTASESALTGVNFPTSRHGPPPAERAGRVEDDGHCPAGTLLARARRQLEGHLARGRTAFELPLDPAGSAFSQQLCHAINDIDYGTIAIYSELA